MAPSLSVLSGFRFPHGYSPAGSAAAPPAMQRSPEDAAPPPLDEEGLHHLFLGNLGVEVDKAFLTRVFSNKFASFVQGSARVKRHQPDGTTRGYGYVTFSEQRDVDAAVAEFDGQRLVGTGRGRLRVSPCLYNSKARRSLPAHLRERYELQKQLFFEERSRRRLINEGKHQT